MEETAKASNGSVTFKLFTSGQLISLSTMQTGLRDRVVDIGLVVFTYHRANFPVSMVVGDLALLGKDNAVMAAVSSEFYMLKCAPCLKEAVAAGVLPLSGLGTTPYVVLSRVKLATLEDFKGQKIRSGGTAFTTWINAVGGTVVSVPTNETYQALNQGVIDGGISTLSTLRAFGLWDVAKHVTRIPIGLYSAGSVFGASTGFWEELNDQERQAVLTGVSAGMTALNKRYEEDDDSVIEPAKKLGVVFHEPSAELLALNNRLSLEAIATAKENARADNIADGEQLIDTYAGLIDKWTKLLAPVRQDVAAVRALYDREIFSKIDPSSFGN